jgi:hypothetical protein
MVRAIVGREFDYVLERERVPPDSPEDTTEQLQAKAKLRAEQTVFHLLRLTSGQRFKLTNNMGKINARTQDITPLAGDLTRDALLAGLNGWTNFKMEDPENPGELIDVPFEREKSRINVLGSNIFPPRAAMFDYFDQEDLVELGQAIQDGSSLTVGEAGN